MDDADGGRRGLRPRPGPELWRALAGHWGLEAAAAGIDLGGSSSLNLLVAGGGRRYVARAHLLRGVEGGRAGRRPPFANHPEPADVPAVTRRATTRVRGWGPSAAEADLAAGADRLADLVAGAEAALVSQLPRQLVHGDFWDDNVLFRSGRPVLLADFDLMGERARVDDLALTLRCAASDLGAGAGAGPAELRARLGRLVAGYDRGLEVPLPAVAASLAVMADLDAWREALA